MINFYRCKLVKLIKRELDLVGAHHVVDGLDDFGHLGQVDESVPVDIIHAKN